MRVLIACEFSGIVRDAFAARGHDAWSCDLLPCERGGKHYQMDCRKIINDEWDIVIAHPPCTYLCNSGVRWLVKNGWLLHDRFELMKRACDLFADVYWSDSETGVCVENPVMHKHARIYLDKMRQVPVYDQIIHPWQFGHGETKATCLWLKNLSKLVPTDIVSGRTPRVHYASPGPHRWKVRSRTLPGIAKAMAEQWSNL